jgi:hypothetical protein
MINILNHYCDNCIDTHSFICHLGLCIIQLNKDTNDATMYQQYTQVIKNVYFMPLY